MWSKHQVVLFLLLGLQAVVNAFVISINSQLSNHQSSRYPSVVLHSSSSSLANSNNNVPHHHVVRGIECIEVPMDIPEIGRVVVLEATAEAQEVLVNLALEDDEKPGTPCSESQDAASLQSGDPYGAVLWPAAYAIAARILQDPTYRTELPQMTVLELGAGTGLVSLSLLLAGTKHVIATDYESIPLELLEYAVDKLNNNPNTDNNQQQQQEFSITYQLLDMRDHATPLPTADLVVAADIMYEPKTGRAMAKRAVEALQQGARVLVGDSPGRPGRGAFLDELQNLGVVGATFVDTVGYTCSGPRHDLICGKDSTSVSETPQELLVAIMELDPKVHLSAETVISGDSS
ncbi:Putative methyltransferase [Seminavis robusta]|uniref:Methyltransferase n=1 Tax=Seminavis robusta TaxID=568900 RepID=A0A9N8HYP6_9STRA|nr:Putative methyltransferase [Seminavis robusta]|eukprot:Sro2588_g331990.1 Putative methyltransferase (347) ;mRNA; f:5220-6260